MINPFVEFRPVNYQIKENPLERIARVNQEISNAILDGYRRLAEVEIKDLGWVVEHSRVVKAYGAAVERLRDLKFDQEDIEEFCAALSRSDGMPYMIAGPAGLYVSALVNHCQENRIQLSIGKSQRTFHFLGYGLVEGKTLMIQGDAGDFAGTALSGGHLVVQGSVGNWCGAGMMNGEIRVKEHSGRKTGEWMQGGQLHVDGQIKSVGKNRFGGRIYQQDRLISPETLVEDSRVTK
jgi:hypothetical protein